MFPLCWNLEHFTKLDYGDSNNWQEKCNYCCNVYGYYYKQYGTSQLKSCLEEYCKKSTIRCSLIEMNQSRLKIGLKRMDVSSGGSMLKGFYQVWSREM